MEVRYCDVEMVQIGNRLRSLDPKKVAALAESMATIGLQQPISVWSDSVETLELVAGLHRLEAARKLGWEDIDCIFVGLDDLDRQLWEIDENLMRADLSPAEMAEHTAKRAEVVKQKVEFLKLRKTESDPSQNADKGQGDFDEDTAKATGKSKSTVRRDKARGEAIPADVLARIQGTNLDKGTYLDKLKKLPREEMRERVDLDLRVGWRERKPRRTSAEIRLEDFDHTVRSISTSCSCLPKINVPDIDSKRRSRAVADLRNAIKHIQESIEIIQGRD